MMNEDKHQLEIMKENYESSEVNYEREHVTKVGEIVLNNVIIKLKDREQQLDHN